MINRFGAKLTQADKEAIRSLIAAGVRPRSVGDVWLGSDEIWQGGYLGPTNSRKSSSPGEAPALVRSTAASLNCWTPWV